MGTLRNRGCAEIGDTRNRRLRIWDAPNLGTSEIGDLQNGDTPNPEPMIWDTPDLGYPGFHAWLIYPKHGFDYSLYQQAWITPTNLYQTQNSKA